MTTVIWNMRVRPEAHDDGLAIIRQIWHDMQTKFRGYESHRLLVDEDQRGHFIVVSDWTSRQDADQSLEQYKNADTVKRLTPLLAEPRVRNVLCETQ